MLKSFDSSLSNKLVSFDSAYNLWLYIEAHHEILKEMRIQETSERKSSKTMEVSSSLMYNSSTSCTRPLGNGPSEVSLETEDEDINIPYDELASAFDKLTRAYDILQNNHDILVSKLHVISNEKDIILEEHEKLKNDHNILSMKYENALVSCNSISNEFDVFKSIHENCTTLNDSNVASTSSTSKDKFYDELKWMNNRIDDLSLTLSNCAHTTKNLVSVASKNNGSHIAHHGLSKPKNKVHKQKGKPTHHAHLYAKVQKCTTCGRKGHVAKFCNTTYKRIQNPAPYKNVHASQPHSHAPIPYLYDVVYKCTICGRRGHLAKFCYDAPHSAQKPVSHVSNKNASTSKNSSHYA